MGETGFTEHENIFWGMGLIKWIYILIPLMFMTVYNCGNLWNTIMQGTSFTVSKQHLTELDLEKWKTETRFLDQRV